VAGRIRSIEKSSDRIGNRTHDLPASNIVSQSTALPLAPCKFGIGTYLDHDVSDLSVFMCERRKGSYQMKVTIGIENREGA
jgi:hypothetical protein